jgi:hypothetical protein
MSTSAPIEPPPSDDTWCDARGVEVAQCLARQGVDHGRIGEYPAWHVMPYASLWAVESLHRPEWIGWWVIAGDLPSDLIAAQDLDTPRQALRAFGQRWGHHADALDRGEVPAAWAHVDHAQLPALAALLRRRGAALHRWADDDGAWPADEA